MTASELNDEQRKVLDKVEKLLRLAGGTTSEEEAASAAAKAQDLLTAYNMDMSVVGSASNDEKREKTSFEGGFYEYERDLWAWVADVCYCIYWTQNVTVERSAAEQSIARVAAYKNAYKRRFRTSKQHKVIGRKVSVITATNMVNYLMETIERLAKEYLLQHLEEGESLSGALRSRRAVSFREGCAASIIRKLRDKRIEQREAEAAKASAAAERAAAAGTSSSRSMTLAELHDSERDANMDVLYGVGYSARTRAERAEREAKLVAAEAELVEWAKAHPEEAAKKAKEKEIEDAKARKRYTRTYVEKLKDWSAYDAGRERGKHVGLDPQVDASKTKRQRGSARWSGPR